jgi:hypothetical protein
MGEFTKQERGDGFRVSMSVARQIIHEADLPKAERGQVFGGDDMGHWDATRALLLAKAFRVKPMHWPIPPEERTNMARVSPLDMDYVRKLASEPITDPLIFLDFGDGTGPDARMMMIDGHHRMMATVLRKQDTVPVFALWHELRPLIRVVQMIETTRYMEPPPIETVIMGEHRIEAKR